MWPLSVFGAESERYFWPARAVKPGHVENCLLLIAFTSVCFGGLNTALWRYFMSAAFDVMAYALYAMCPVFLFYVLGDVALQSCNGNTHNRVCGSLPYLHTILLL